MSRHGVPPVAVGPKMSSEHLPLRPFWLCHRCGQPWPCGAAKLALLAEYREARVSLFLYLAGCLHDAIDDLHRHNASVTGSAADLFDRFLGWPARVACPSRAD